MCSSSLHNYGYWPFSKFGKLSLKVAGVRYLWWPSVVLFVFLIIFMYRWETQVEFEISANLSHLYSRKVGISYYHPPNLYIRKMGVESSLPSLLIASFFVFQHCVWNQLCSFLLYWSGKNVSASSTEGTSEDQGRETRRFWALVLPKDRRKTRAGKVQMVKGLLGRRKSG